MTIGLGHHKKQAIARSPLAVPPREAGRLLSLSISRVYLLMRTGELQSYKDGKSRRIPMKSIEAHLKRRLAAAVGKGWEAWEHSPFQRKQRPVARPKRRARISQLEAG